MKQIRVLHVVNGLNRGGMESRTMDIYRKINKDIIQYDFYVESGLSGVYEEEIEKMGGKVYHNRGAIKLNIPNFFAFSKFLKTHHYQVVYAYNQWAGYYLGIAKKRGTKVRVASSRTALQANSWQNIIKNFVKTNVRKNATHCFAVSSLAGDWLFGKNSQYMVWPNAIDAKKYSYSETIRQEVRNELGLNNEFTIIHVGNIRYPKNHPFLLKVFSEIQKKQKEAKLILVGEGNYKDLEAQIETLGLKESVLYLGVRNDIERLLQAGDAFVFPSLYEGFPGAVLEAQASGLPCFISDAITKEIMLTNRVYMLSLESNAVVWADFITNHYNVINRENAWEDIVDAGYDTSTLIRKTEDFLITACQ